MRYIKPTTKYYIWIGLEVLACVFFIWISIVDYNTYCFPYIYDLQGYIYITGITAGLPLILLILTIASYHFKEEGWTRICIILFIPVCICCMIRASVEVVSPTIYSYTTNEENIGIFDSPMEVPEEFPREIPENAQEVEYLYFYTNMGSWDWYVAAAWKYADNAQWKKEYEKVKAQAVCEWMEVYSMDKLKIYFDTSEKKVYYVTCRRDEFYPANADEVFTWSPHGTVFVSS